MSKLNKVLNNELTSEKVEKKGQRIYKNSKWCIFIGICGFSLLAVICLLTLLIGGTSSVLSVLSLTISGGYEFLIPIVILCYIAIVIGFFGPAGYFLGITIFSLGRIAVNSESQYTFAGTNKNITIKNRNNNSNNTSERKIAKGQKECWACGSVQPESNTFCRNCNESI